MSVEAAPRAKPPRRLLLWIAAAPVLLAVLALAWTLLWHLAAGESKTLLDAWIAREASLGRIWSCPDRTTSGFPFAIEIACTKPRFDGTIFGGHFAGGLDSFQATAAVYHPRSVVVRLASPFTALSDDRETKLELAWDDLRVTLDGLPQSIWRVSINGEKLAWGGAFGNLGTTSGAADHLSVDAAEQPDREDRAYDFTMAVTNASLPDLDRFLGATLPAEITLQGTLTKARFDPALDVIQNIDRWRAAGGRLDLANANLTHGDTMLSAHGSLDLDAQHRPRGKLETESRGLEPLLLRLGVNPTLVSAGALLGSIITGALPSGGQAPAQNLVVSVGFEDGRVSIGPAHTSIHVPPLY